MELGCWDLVLEWNLVLGIWKLPPGMWQSLEKSLTRYRDLEQQMADPAVIADRTRYTQAAKEHGSLAKLVKPYLEYQKISEDVSHAEALVTAEGDPEMRKYVEEELVGLQTR